MALSELDMMNLWAKQLRGYKSQWERLFDFGYAIEVAVRKNDEVLIRQMLAMLESGSTFLYKHETLVAARARLKS